MCWHSFVIKSLVPKLYQGKHLILGGSSALVQEGKKAIEGDLSAIIVKHLAALV